MPMSLRARGLPLVAALFFALLLALPAGARAETESNFALDALADVTLGTPIQDELAILIPLVVPKAPAASEVVTQWSTDGLSFAEPEFPSRRYNVEAKNASKSPVLVLGGTVLVGGLRDRMIRHSVILAPGETVELESLPAESTNSARKEAVPFRMAQSIAPLYLRRKADFGGGSGLVGTFVARNLEFRNPGDSRKSLAAVGESKVLQDATKQTRARLTDTAASTKQSGVIVGAISAMRGRIQGLTLYGTHELFKGSVGAYLLGGTYSAAAIAIQAQKKNVPLPGRDDAEKTLSIVMKDAQDLLDKLSKGRFKEDKDHPNGQDGKCLVIQLSDGTRGHALGRDGRLIHMAIYPHDPFESAYYGSSISLPEEDILYDPDRIGAAELARRAAGGARLSEYEKRLLGGLRGSGGVAGSPGVVQGSGGFRGGGVGRR